MVLINFFSYSLIDEIDTLISNNWCIIVGLNRHEENFFITFFMNFYCTIRQSIKILITSGHVMLLNEYIDYRLHNYTYTHINILISKDNFPFLSQIICAYGKYRFLYA
jgi:hypothetical protein